MDISNSYNIQGLSGVHANTLEKIGSAKAINKAADDPSGLAISDSLGVQKSSLTQSLQNMNSGIAMTTIAQGGIKEQQTILENIKLQTLQAMNDTTSDEGKDAIAQQISKYIDQYEQIASSTTYNGQTLLETAGEVSDDISIVGDETIIPLDKADTRTISESLKSFLSDFTSNPDSMSGLLDAVDEGIDKLSTYSSNYGSAQNQFEAYAKNAMATEKEVASARSTVLDIDYAQEVADFSKSNLQTQIGFLMQTQANALQAKNIALLS
ncbi:MAG: flagellin [Campylobacterota bacterium]|nr:flagellin [Campylobacterota bacterium]